MEVERKDMNVCLLGAGKIDKELCFVLGGGVLFFLRMKIAASHSHSGIYFFLDTYTYIIKSCVVENEICNKQIDKFKYSVLTKLLKMASYVIAHACRGITKLGDD
jgi:hypothetical protein